MIFANYAAVDPTLLQLLNLAGVGDFLHIITAGFVTRAGLLAIKRIGVLPS